MRISIALLITISTIISQAQSLPFTFESDITTTDFVDFDGGVATVIDNPQKNGINTSDKVAQIVRNGGAIWSGSKIQLSANLNFSTDNTLKMKVYTTAPIGTVVKFKLESTGSTERDAVTTKTGEWEELIWDFTGAAADFDFVVFMFDFGNVGDGTASSTFLFDDVEQVFGGYQIDLPVSFEQQGINYTLTDFGGTQSNLIPDPEDSTNTVAKVIKTSSAATWAGTTIGTNSGFLNFIPLSLTDSKMKVKVWSPDAGIPVRLKVEDHRDPTHTCETQTNTSVANAWEVLEFDFTNQATGTESLSVGLSMGWVYNMASIFFNFDTDGATAGEKTYYFDNVEFGNNTVGIDQLSSSEIKVSPNPTSDFWQISASSAITRLVVIDARGQIVLENYPNSRVQIIKANDLQSGIYVAHLTTTNGSYISKIIKN